ncbi:MAG TPA: PHB depolymerase family esterase [Rhizomicrobium sp.]|nr:PHB depolymerase family esterase [Rhizomicrobium sp.]
MPLPRARPVPPVSNSTLRPTLTEQAEFGDNPGALRMFAYAPPSLPKNAPLIVVLHGCGQSAGDYAHGAGWLALADELTFAVLAPEQTRANNMNTCFNWFQPGDCARDQGEAASIRQMIELLAADRDLDRSRIFITGLSAGGAMTAAMLAAYPELFAGGAIIAGLPAGSAANVPEALNSMRQAPARSAEAWGAMVRQASSHQGPWPAISVWHGDADATVHVSNAEALVAQWTSVHGLPQKPMRIEKEGAHCRNIWKRDDGTVAVEAFLVSGMGHGTPIGGPAGNRYGETGPFFLDVGFSSSARIAGFWGLDTTNAVAADVIRPTEPSAPASETVAPQSVWTPAPKQEGRVKAVILAALKTAGLLKD